MISLWIHYGYTMDLGAGSKAFYVPHPLQCSEPGRPGLRWAGHAGPRKSGGGNRILKIIYSFKETQSKKLPDAGNL